MYCLLLSLLLLLRLGRRLPLHLRKLLLLNLLLLHLRRSQLRGLKLGSSSHLLLGHLRRTQLLVRKLRSLKFMLLLLLLLLLDLLLLSRLLLGGLLLPDHRPTRHRDWGTSSPLCEVGLSDSQQVSLCSLISMISTYRSRIETTRERKLPSTELLRLLLGLLLGLLGLWLLWLLLHHLDRLLPIWLLHPSLLRQNRLRGHTRTTPRRGWAGSCRCGSVWIRNTELRR